MQLTLRRTASLNPPGSPPMFEGEDWSVLRDGKYIGRIYRTHVSHPRRPLALGGIRVHSGQPTQWPCREPRGGHGCVQGSAQPARRMTPRSGGGPGSGDHANTRGLQATSCEGDRRMMSGSSISIIPTADESFREILLLFLAQQNPGSDCRCPLRGWRISAFFTAPIPQYRKLPLPPACHANSRGGERLAQVRIQRLSQSQSAFMLPSTSVYCKGSWT